LRSRPAVGDVAQRLLLPQDVPPPSIHGLALLVWIVVMPMLIMPVFGVVVAVSASTGFPQFLMMLVAIMVSCVFVGGVLGGVLYLLNLPFMLLAVRCPLFRNRFHNAFRLPHPAANGASQQTLAAGCDEG
jgi:hypothetical protein